MIYRKDIDGLRAISVISVVLSHSGFKYCSGGGVGVDVFFVISGYLIINIILEELDGDRFSIRNFFEKRALRILPTLFVVNYVCLIFGWFSLMPDEYKNLGQSVVASTLFANNILLSLTSDYWDLASEFKPLLHTWSLGVEEQYYFITPLLVVLFKKKQRVLFCVITLLTIASFNLNIFYFNSHHKWVFYNLITRGWEIGLGAMTGFIMRWFPHLIKKYFGAKAMSEVGLVLVVLSIFRFDRSEIGYGVATLLPTVGTVFIILSDSSSSVCGKILGHKFLVAIGLMSYSIYLWHQPIFAFIRAVSKNEPSALTFLFGVFVNLIVGYLSWRYIETTFRKPKNFKISSYSVLFYSGVLLVFSGAYLNLRYGIPTRMFESNVKINDLDKRIYNEKIFQLKVDSFREVGDKNVLIIGNSFARDFVNIILETFATNSVDLVYRDDFGLLIYPYSNTVSERLFSEADIIVFASGAADRQSIDSNIEYGLVTGKSVFYIGTKNFGWNLNWIAWLSELDRKNLNNKLPEEIIKQEGLMAALVPNDNYVSLIGPVIVSNSIPITDNKGRLLSPDRAHLTKFGAIYFGEKSLKNTRFSYLLFGE